MLAAPQLARTACCYWSFCCQMKPHDTFISFLQDIIRNIVMWVTIHDPFASNLGIDDNWNWLDYPWIFIIPLPFFLYVESCLCNPKSSVFTYTYYCIHIVILQTQTAESVVLHPTLPNWPLILLQTPNTTEYYENRVFFWLVCCIWKFIFTHYPQQTQFEPMKPQLLQLTKVPTVSSVQVLPDSSTHRHFCATQPPLISLN
jgi:hypothetical protein